MPVRQLMFFGSGVIRYVSMRGRRLATEYLTLNVRTRHDCNYRTALADKVNQQKKTAKQVAGLGFCVV